jgi:hypothetical protein
MNQIDFFNRVCAIVVVRLLPNFNNVETFGQKYYINHEDRTLVSPEFFIRFTDGSIVMLVWDDIRNWLNVSVAFDGGSEADKAFDIPYKNTMLSAMNPAYVGNLRALIEDPSTWYGELRESIMAILSYAEAGKLAELFSKNGTDSDGVKYVNRNPNAEPEQISEADCYKKLREFKF